MSNSLKAILAATAIAASSAVNAAVSNPKEKANNIKQWDILPEVVAEVNGKKITRQDVVEEISKRIPNGNMPAIPKDQLKPIAKQTLNLLIDKMIFEKLLKNSGIVPSPELAKKEIDSVKADPQKMKMLEANLKSRGESLESFEKKMINDKRFQFALAIDEWIKKNIADKANVPKEEAEKFYRENQERFKTPDSVKVAHILIRNDIPRDKEGNALEEFAKTKHANIANATVDGKRRADYKNLKDATADGKRRANYANIKDAKLSGNTNPDSMNMENSAVQGKDHANRENISISDREAERRLNRPNLSETKLARGVTPDSANIINTQTQAQKHLDRVNLEEADKLALLKAEGVRAKILQGEDFGKLAKQNSDCEISSQHGGNLGYISHGQMFKEFEDAAFALKPGEISKVVKARDGYHIIKAIDKRKGGYVPFEKLEPVISRRLKNRKIQEEIRKALDSEKEKMNIKMNI